jgi:diguanylate cyclase (GGDEF)-like protein
VPATSTSAAPPRAGWAAGRPRLSGPGQVWLLTVLLGAVAVALTGGMDRAPAWGGLWLPWWALLVMFVGAEVFVVHLPFRRDSQSVSLSEVPLVLGLMSVAPATLVIVRVLGALLALVVHRRQAGLKLAFNLAHFAFEACLATIIFRAILGGADLSSSRTWIAAFAATLATDLSSAVLVTGAISLYEQQFDGGRTWPVLVVGGAAAATNTSIALLGIVVLRYDPRGMLLLAVVAATVFCAYRAYTSLSQSYARLEQLYGFTRAIGSSIHADAVVEAMLAEARALLRAELAQVVLFPTADEPGVSIVLDGDGAAVAERPPPGAEPGAGTWWRSVVAGEGVCIRRPVRTGARRQLAEAGLKDAMAAPLRGEAGVIGVMLVANRLGDVDTFSADDLKLLETLANHASVSLENGRLVDRLRHEAVEKEHQALHDWLTGLPNRRLFHLRVDEALSAGDRGVVAVMLMDLDRFKDINDTLGHHIGDVLLEEVAVRLLETLHGRAVVARLGGDEFALMVAGVAGEDEATGVAGEVVRALERPFAIQGFSLSVSASIGLALSPAHGDAAAVLLQRADVAMYSAKLRRSGLEVYATERDQYSPRRLALVGDLGRAIDEGQLVVHYQPQAELATGRVVGVEALVRWFHPVHGLLPPDEFVPLAEQTGLIRPLTLFVLETALQQCATWRDAGLPVNLAVNLSVRSLLDVSLPDDVARLLDRMTVPPHALTLEITESDIMGDPRRTTEVLTALHDLGVGVAIDDFGTGYSSLAYVKRLPVDEIKIDKSFVCNMANDDHDAAIVRSTVQLSHSLGLRVVAEGVEDRDSWNRLLAMGCDVVQGYYLSRPEAGEVLTHWLRTVNRPERPSVLRRLVPAPRLVERPAASL